MTYLHEGHDGGKKVANEVCEGLYTGKHVFLHYSEPQMDHSRHRAFNQP